MKDEYLSYYKKGFLPGPNETEKAFLNRIKKVQDILNHPKKFITDSSFQKTIFEPFKNCGLLFTPQRNSPVYASQTLILETEDKTLIPLIKTPSKFSLKFINANEIINHELVHARRILFNDDHFEEILAYRQSPSFFRRFFSPLIISRLELSLFFIFALMSISSMLPLISATLYLLIRLILKQNKITKCIQYLKKKTPHYEEILMAMTDEEINNLSKMKLAKIDFSLFRWTYLQTLFGKII
ncbi:MAG: hypothetical protein S4CHLAM20_05770 [Chlamydiia bacterium]|nr:hypothetical protein [Chlamydiia bacterium]